MGESRIVVHYLRDACHPASAEYRTDQGVDEDRRQALLHPSSPKILRRSRRNSANSLASTSVNWPTDDSSAESGNVEWRTMGVGRHEACADTAP
jgi:hypothetical protein